MRESSQQAVLTAVNQFRSARLRASLEQVWSTITRRPTGLLSYEEVRRKVKARETAQRDLRDVALKDIVGSVGRYTDFTRNFLPRVEEDQMRWTRVHAKTESLEGVPPIELFQIGEVYFVRDGNHRVSVAREMGFERIEAYVTLVETNIPLGPDITPDDLIIKERYAIFLEKTKLDQIDPKIDLSMSVAGNYRVLERRIGIHHHWMEETLEKPVSFSEAAADWYETIYKPVIQHIRQRGILRDFSKRTETDLYVWIEKHQERLANQLGWAVDAETAVMDIVTSYSRNPKHVMHRVSERLRDVVTPAVLEPGPAPGTWRESWQSAHKTNRLFSHILVAISGQDASWLALEQAIRIARKENGRIHGLHVVQHGHDSNTDRALAVKQAFETRCAEANVPAELKIEAGHIVNLVNNRARWTDLVVISLAHPPGPQPVDRLNSSISQLLRRCPRPVLTVPRAWSQINKLLLAYDGSPKAKEAMYVASYISGQWQVPLLVVTVGNKQETSKVVAEVKAYLETQQLFAKFVQEQGNAAAIIMENARRHECGLLVMGGYGSNPVMEIMLGSTVDELLRTRNRPVLICR
ncbi:MAG: universal stress protein [Chloroflexi bacterium]|nr:universal stress protein [Chloroflexota bacterium]